MIRYIIPLIVIGSVSNDDWIIEYNGILLILLLMCWKLEKYRRIYEIWEEEKI